MPRIVLSIIAESITLMPLRTAASVIVRLRDCVSTTALN